MFSPLLIDPPSPSPSATPFLPLPLLCSLTIDTHHHYHYHPSSPPLLQHYSKSLRSTPPPQWDQPYVRRVCRVLRNFLLMNLFSLKYNMETYFLSILFIKLVCWCVRAFELEVWHTILLSISSFWCELAIFLVFESGQEDVTLGKAHTRQTLWALKSPLVDTV